ncbi:MAG: endolytic transglycosylase MltG [Clostridia bacterium]|nr:endolytic transglycosylase MltG [Clostridia bacterium]
MNNDKNLDKYKKYLEEDSDKEAVIPQEITAPKAEKKKKKSTALPIAIVAIIVLICGALGAGFLFKDDIKNIVKPTTTIPPEPTNVVTVTFPEGYTIYQMGGLLEESGVCSKEEFYQAANSPVDGIEITNPEERAFLLEGYLFPDTYEFYLDEDVHSVISRFIDNYNTKITPEIQKKAADLGYTMDEMLTLASIIQKECDFDIEECKNVSSVFHNRLKNSRETYLGSDVTYFYLKNMADFLGGSDSQKFDYLLTKYYTYNKYRKGLPAGAICNPGIKAITAAVEPADTDYYYFLTDKSGTDFYYAETYNQHLANGKKAGIM